jgi:hypothetical protein
MVKKGRHKFSSKERHWKMAVGRGRRRWEGSIKIGLEDLNWNELAYVWSHLRAFIAWWFDFITEYVDQLLKVNVVLCRTGLLYAPCGSCFEQSANRYYCRLEEYCGYFSDRSKGCKMDLIKCVRSYALCMEKRYLNKSLLPDCVL